MGTSDVGPKTATLSNNHQQVLQETIRSFLIKVCKMILPHHQQLAISGTIGVTVDCAQVLLVHLTEMVAKEGSTYVQVQESCDSNVPTISEVFSLSQTVEDREDTMRRSPVDQEIDVPCDATYTGYSAVDSSALAPLIIEPQDETSGSNNNSPIVKAEPKDFDYETHRQNTRSKHFQKKTPSVDDGPKESPLDKGKEIMHMPVRQELGNYGTLLTNLAGMSTNNPTSRVVGSVWSSPSQQQKSYTQSGFSFGRTLAQLAATAATSPRQGYEAEPNRKSSTELHTMLQSSPCQYHLRNRRQPRHPQKCSCCDDNTGPTTYQDMESSGELAPAEYIATRKGPDNEGNQSPTQSTVSTDSGQSENSLLGRLLKGYTHSSLLHSSSKRKPEQQHASEIPHKIARESTNSGHTVDEADDAKSKSESRTPSSESVGTSSALRQLLCVGLKGSYSQMVPGVPKGLKQRSSTSSSDSRQSEIKDVSIRDDDKYAEYFEESEVPTDFKDNTDLTDKSDSD